MRRILILLTTIALTIGAAVAPPRAEAASCVSVWLTTPTYFGRVTAGANRCIWPDDKTSNGWIRLYQFDNRTEPVVDWIDPWAYTRVAPNNGLHQLNADRVRRLARKYDVRLQFAVKDLHGRYGCQGEFTGQLSGAYKSSPYHPGEGLVRIGTGTTSTCMRDYREARATGLHEMAHALIERHCGTWTAGMRPPTAEHVTDAYAYRYMDAWERNPGGYGFGPWAWRKAGQIHNGNC